MRTAEQVLADPAASNWLKAVLQSALLRDPVDAVNDVEVIAEILRMNLNKLVAQHLFSNLTAKKNNNE